MSKTEPTALTEAATAFDRELAVYARLGELFLKTPLTSLKHLERANQTLGEIADCEGRLQAAGAQLIAALGASRQHQEQLAHDVVAHAPLVQARNAKLAELMTAMAALAGDVAAINTLTAKEGTAADPGGVSATVLELSARAQTLATTAREAELEEVATQAHALHQRLAAIGLKLQKAAGN